MRTLQGDCAFCNEAHRFKILQGFLYGPFAYPRGNGEQRKTNVVPSTQARMPDDVDNVPFVLIQ